MIKLFKLPHLHYKVFYCHRDYLHQMSLNPKFRLDTFHHVLIDYFSSLTTQHNKVNLEDKNENRVYTTVDSKGLPGKNIKNFLGEPLVARTIRIAKESNCFDRIIVNTDDNEIAEVAENAGAEILLRPEEMGSDTAEVDPLIIWSLDRLNATQEKNLISLLYCTAPLRNKVDI